MRAGILALAGALALAGPGAEPAGEWRAALDIAGGELRFGVVVERDGGGWRGRLCNGTRCQPFTAVTQAGDSIVLEMADYAAGITAKIGGDSMAGTYRNVGNRGPRIIPFRASRGRWPVSRAPARLIGRWDAMWIGDFGTTPRVLDLRNGKAGLEGTVISNTGDYGHFAGQMRGDSFALAHFDGSYVYMLTGSLSGGDGKPDTLRGLFHAGIRTQTPFIAVRSTGKPHLKTITENTTADTTEPFRFTFPDLDGRTVTEQDPRFKGKVVMVDVFGTWCPTCHDAAPELVKLYRKYHDQGLEIVGLAYEVSGDTAVDHRQVRRFREKFGITYPMLLAGINLTDAAAATLPQLQGFTAFPTTIFLGRDGKVRRIHAGFYGPATGAQHAKQVRDWEEEVRALLDEKRKE